MEASEVERIVLEAIELHDENPHGGECTSKQAHVRGVAREAVLLAVEAQKKKDAGIAREMFLSTESRTVAESIATAIERAE